MSNSTRSQTHLSDLPWPWVLLAGLSPPLLSAILALLVSEGCTVFVLNAIKLSKPQSSSVLQRCEAVSAPCSPLLQREAAAGPGSQCQELRDAGVEDGRRAARCGDAACFGVVGKDGQATERIGRSSIP